MIKVLNFFCFAFAALSCLALYHVSEQTRVARGEVVRVEKRIGNEKETMKVLQADWERVSEPSRVQALAASRLGLSDAPTVALASLELLPRRGENLVLGDAALKEANADAPQQLSDAHLHLTAARATN